MDEYDILDEEVDNSLDASGGKYFTSEEIAEVEEIIGRIKRAEDGYFIPKQYIDDPDLGVTSGILLAMIDFWCAKVGKFDKTNKWIATKLSITRTGARDVIIKLRNGGYITTEIGFDNSRTIYRKDKNIRSRFTPKFYAQESTAPSEDTNEGLCGKSHRLYGKSHSPLYKRDKSRDLILSNERMSSANANDTAPKKKPTLVKRTTPLPKVEDDDLSLRDKLNNSHLAPKDEDDKPHNVVTPSKTVRYMIKYWNEKCAEFNRFPKPLNEMHKGEQTKTYKTVVEACRNFVGGSLFTSGKGIIPEHLKDRKHFIRPYTYEDFVVFVDRFCRMLHDNNLKPVCKVSLRENCTLKDFLIGNVFTGKPSMLLLWCLEEPEPVRTMKHPEFLKTIELAWLKYKPGDLSTKDFENFDRMLTWLVPFARTRLNITSDMLLKGFITSKLIESIESSWKNRKPNTSYLATKACEENLVNYLRTLGY